MRYGAPPDEVIRAIDRASRIDSHLLRDQPLREAAEQRTDADAPLCGAQDPRNPRGGEVASPW